MHKMVTLNDSVCAAPSLNDKGIRLNNNPNLKTISLDGVDMSSSVAVKYETKSMRDSFAWDTVLLDPEKYVHRMTNKSEHTEHLDTYMRCEVEFNNYNENDIVKNIANAGKQIDRLYDCGICTDKEYEALNSALTDRTKSLVRQLYSCRAAIEEHDIVANAFNQYNQRIYITEDEHIARMGKLYNNSPIKYDDIVDMIGRQRAAVRKDWLPK